MHVFITGGTRGIGNGLVKEFLRKGHKVSYTGTSEKSISKSIKELSGEYVTFVCDVRYKNHIEIAKSLAVDIFGNAGVDQGREDISDLSEEEIKRVIDINVTGMMLGTSVALEQMKAQGFGIVYNMEGLGSNNMVIPKTLVYGSSKRLLTYFSKGCNKELKEYDKVFVGTLQPGMVFTDLLMNNIGDGMKIAKILGSEVEEVTTFLVKNILNGKKRIKFLTNRKIMWRFMTSPFKK